MCTAHYFSATFLYTPSKNVKVTDAESLNALAHNITVLLPVFRKGSGPWLEIPKAMSIYTVVFWNMTPYKFVNAIDVSEETDVSIFRSCLHLYDSPLYRWRQHIRHYLNTRRHISEDRVLTNRSMA